MVITTWVSELQRSGVIDDPAPSRAYSTNLPSVEIYGRLFAAERGETQPGEERNLAGDGKQFPHSPFARSLRASLHQI